MSGILDDRSTPSDANTDPDAADEYSQCYPTVHVNSQLSWRFILMILGAGLLLVLLDQWDES